MNPQELWKGQEAEKNTMTIQLIHQKARDLRAKTRRQLLGVLTGPLVVLFFFVFAWKTLGPMTVAIRMIFVCALVWSVAGLYFLWRRGSWTGELPAGAGLQSGLEFCRDELRRRERLLGGVLLWSFGPILLSICGLVSALALIAGTGMIPKSVPFLTLVAGWIVAYFVMRWREQRDLLRELRDLD